MKNDIPFKETNIARRKRGGSKKKLSRIALSIYLSDTS